jgi:hypothetical protein
MPVASTPLPSSCNEFCYLPVSAANVEQTRAVRHQRSQGFDEDAHTPCGDELRMQDIEQAAHGSVVTKPEHIKGEKFVRFGNRVDEHWSANHHEPRTLDGSFSIQR